MRAARGCDAWSTREPLCEYPNSPLETVTFNLLVDSGIQIPELQVPLHDRKEFISRPDFVWPEQKVMVEAHSFLRHENEAEKASDREKLDRLIAEWYRVLYVTWVDVTTLASATIRVIESTLAGGPATALSLSDVEKARPDVLQLTQNG